MRYEDDLGEFEIRLLLADLLEDSTEEQASWLAGGWSGDRYRVLGPGFEALVWYSAWDNAAAAARFAKGLARAWARRRQGARRAEIKQLSVAGHPVVRLVDAPIRWRGWAGIPAVRIVQ